MTLSLDLMLPDEDDAADVERRLEAFLLIARHLPAGAALSSLVPRPRVEVR